MAVDALGIRMAHLEGAYEQIDKRLGSLQEEVRDLRRDLHSQFRWTVGLLIIAIFAPIALRLFGH
jgi:hypothetical protein